MRHIIFIAALLAFYQVHAQKNTEGKFPPSEETQKIRIIKTTSPIKVDGD